MEGMEGMEGGVCFHVEIHLLGGRVVGRRFVCVLLSKMTIF